MQADPDLQLVARIAHTFHQDPVRLLNELSPVGLAAFLAAHNVIATDMQAANEEMRRSFDRAKASAATAGRR